MDIRSNELDIFFLTIGWKKFWTSWRDPLSTEKRLLKSVYYNETDLSKKPYRYYKKGINNQQGHIRIDCTAKEIIDYITNEYVANE